MKTIVIEIPVPDEFDDSDLLYKAQCLAAEIWDDWFESEEATELTPDSFKKLMSIVQQDVSVQEQVT